MLSLLGSLAANRRLLKDFVVRDLKARYVGSSMGFFWSVVFPIINLFVYMFVFRLVLKARWSDWQGPLEVALVMLAGIVVWSAFAETVSRSTNSLVENSNLIQKVVFPSEVLPVYLTVSSLINMAIGLPVVMACVLCFAYLLPPEVVLTSPGVPASEAARPELQEPQVFREGGGADAAVVRVVLMRGMSRDVVVPLEFSGSAELGVDYEVAAEQVVIPRGCLEGRVFLNALRDTEQEEAESVVVSIGAAVEGARLGASTSLEFVLEDTPHPAPGQSPQATRPVEVVQPNPNDPPYYPLAMGASLVTLPLLFLLQILFTAGIGYFLATLNLFLRDTYHLVGVGVTVWMFATPIFYPAAMVESAGFGLILDLNPMHWLIENYRLVLLYGRWPDWPLMARYLGAGVVFLFLGSRFFMSQKRRFPDLL